MNPVKDQGQCGSCWAFAATAAIEVRYAIKKGSKVNLSEQQMLDCSPKGDCKGGWSNVAMDYVRDAGGQATATAYRYTGVKSTCKFKAS